MSLSIYNYVCIVLAFWLFRICLKSVLAFRFHCSFGSIGFFSIKDIQYHHHRSSETALWSVKVGKLKLRLKRSPTLSSPTPFLTIYVADIQVQLHSLAALAASRRQQKEKVSTLNKRFSRVSSSLKKIPWWYSLSIVKQVIKFTSALPAQLLMAGLANYVDFQVDNFSLEIEQQAEIKVHDVMLSSVLFANVTIPSSAPSVPNSVPNSPIPNTDSFQNLSERLNSLHSSYQRHSLKRAQHLFKEKFFEIMVKVGTIAVIRPSLTSEPTEILTFPTGGQIAVSCHLSAGCVTLKDVDVNTRIDTFMLKLRPLLDLLKHVKQPTQAKKQDFDLLFQKQQDKHSKAKIIKLLRSITLSVDNGIVETQHGDRCHSLLELQELHLNGISENCVAGIDPYYKLQLLLGLTSWTLFDTTTKEDRQMKIVTLPEIRLNSNLSQDLIIPGKNHVVDVIPSFEQENIFWNSNDSGPNQKYINITLIIQEPRLFVDVSKADMLQSLSTKKQDDVMDSVDDADDLEEIVSDEKEPTTAFNNLPRASLSVHIDRPAIHMKSLQNHMGVISCSDITFEAAGIYNAQKNRPVSVISRFSEPLSPTTVSRSDMDSTEIQADSNTIQRIRSQSRPSWTSLFRRSWKSKAADEKKQKNAVEWHYKSSVRLLIQNTCFEDVFEPKKPKLDSRKQFDSGCDSNAFISVGNFEYTAHTRFDVSFVNDVVDQHIRVVWDPDAHHINVDISVDKPILNLWTKTPIVDESQLEFWVNGIAGQIKLALKKDPPVESHIAADRDMSEVFGYVSILKVNATISDAVVVLEGIDKGIKGKRPIPAGFLDNAPDKDIDVRIIVTIQRVSLVFNGSRIFGATRKRHRASQSIASLTTEDSDDNQELGSESLQQVSFGTSRLSIQHTIIERIFKSNDSVEEQGWHDYEDKKSVILWISRINTRTDMLLENSSQIVLVPSIVVKKNGIQYTITNHYACLIVAHSVMDLMNRCFPKKNKDTVPNSATKKTKFQKLQLQINRSDIHVFLPGGDTELYIRMDSLRTQWDSGVEHQGEVPPTAIRNVTLYGVAPRKPGQWDQLMEMDNMRFSIEKDVDFTCGTLKKSNQLSMSKFYMRIPYGYELSEFVDGTVTLIKAIKASHTRIYKGNSFLFFGPSEKKTPAVIPHMRFICDLFTFQFEDDPFEARLRSIWKTGVVEQANRIAIQDAFEAKAQSFMNTGDKKKGSEKGNTKLKHYGIILINKF